MYLLCFRMTRIQKQYIKDRDKYEKRLKKYEKKQNITIAFHKMLANKHGKLLMF